MILGHLSPVDDLKQIPQKYTSIIPSLSLLNFSGLQMFPVNSHIRISDIRHVPIAPRRDLKIKDDTLLPVVQMPQYN
jgi:hypothetical protein